MIVTFYSFKGGVGRSLALTEVATQLAVRGCSVVVWDLDLEAPGIQKIPNLQQLDRKLELGTLDLLLQFQESDYTFPEESLRQAVLPFSLPSRIAEARGRLAFLLPGRLDESYAVKFGSIDWAQLFAPQAGPGLAFFYTVAKHLTERMGFDVLLIDSRTGFSDLGAICTLKLPDLVVLVFNLNRQNLAGIELVHQAVTQAPARYFGRIPVFLFANMVPPEPEELLNEQLQGLRKKGLRPHHMVSLRPELLLTDQVPTLADLPVLAEEFTGIVREIEDRRHHLEQLRDRETRDRTLRAYASGDPAELDRERSFLERVLDLFSVLGYDSVVNYEKEGLRFGARLEMTGGALPIYGLVECTDSERPVTQQQVQDLAERVVRARKMDKRPYQAILVSRAGFTESAHAVAEEQFVQLLTFQQLLLTLVDLSPHLDTAIRSFQGTALERLYVEPHVLVERASRPGELSSRSRLVRTVLDWLDRPGSSFFALLGDVGSGKTSFCRRIAHGQATRAREKPDEVRTPVLIDLREIGSSIVTLENLLAQPVNAQALLHLNREGYLVLLIDGFDETIGYSEPGQTLENLRQILRAAEGKAKVLLTCRTHYFLALPEGAHGPVKDSSQHLTSLYREIQEQPGAEVGYLQDFNEAQISEYLQKALPPPHDWQAFREELYRNHGLGALAERAFLLEIIVKTLPSLERAERGAWTLATLYQAYCETWFSAHHARAVLPYHRRIALIDILARLVWDSPHSRVHLEDLLEKASGLFPERPLGPEKERLDFELRTASFLHRDAEGYYSFAHRSLLEFFVARTLRDGLIQQSLQSLALRRLTREVAAFLELWPEAERIPALSGEALTREYREQVSENALLLLYFHSLARLGLLSTPVLCEEDLARLRKTFSEMRPEVLYLQDANLEGVRLPGIDFDDASLEGARLAYAELRAASLKGARLVRADLSFADLRDVLGLECDLSEANLHHVDACGADFRQARLESADLTFGHFAWADLESACLERAVTTGAGFLGAGLPLKSPVLDITAGPPQLRQAVVRPQLGHFGVSNCIAWGPGGLSLASSGDQTVKIWDWAAGTLLATLEGHRKLVRWISWSPTANTWLRRRTTARRKSGIDSLASFSERWNIPMR